MEVAEASALAVDCHIVYAGIGAVYGIGCSPKRLAVGPAAVRGGSLTPLDCINAGWPLWGRVGHCTFFWRKAGFWVFAVNSKGIHRIIGGEYPCFCGE